MLIVELVVAAEVDPPFVVVVVDFKAFAGGDKVLAEGVYSAVDVSALEPADVEPVEEELEAAAPVVPEEEFACT